MSPKDKPQVSGLPVQYQSVNIDIESISPLKNFDPVESYDVANMTAVLSVNIPQEQDYRLLLSCNVESGTHGTVRTVSLDDKFDKVVDFVRITKKESVDFFSFLDKSGFLPADASQEQKSDYVCENFKQAVVTIPSGQQKLRIQASQKMMPVNNNPREYSLKSFAPMLGFSTGSGQVNLSLVVTFPPAFEVSNMVIDTPVIEQIPGQPTPTDATTPYAGAIGAVRAFAWHWKTDPKVTINYRYQ